jgi:hypothetical protein
MTNVHCTDKLNSIKIEGRSKWILQGQVDSDDFPATAPPRPPCTTCPLGDCASKVRRPHIGSSVLDAVAGICQACKSLRPVGCGTTDFKSQLVGRAHADALGNNGGRREADNDNVV